MTKRLTIPVVPDRLFALAYPDNTIHHFALELDRGTMDIWANRLVGKSSIRRKLIGYFHSREQKRFAETWGFKSFRVLTVTTSDSRIDSMLQAQRRVAPRLPARSLSVLDTGAHRTTRCARAGVGHEQERQRLVAPRQGCQSRSSSNANVHR